MADANRFRPVKNKHAALSSAPPVLPPSDHKDGG